ncbi:MAG: carboxypeptidase regulatory-like domain-containing protein [Bacteroidales bacterium]|nr:carboxypeptidase regulatory-like domain-containing protein [Bacteroidales bacterium]
MQHKTIILILTLMLLQTSGCKKNAPPEIVDGELSGWINDSQSQQPVSGARVLILKAGMYEPVAIVNTDTTGYYTATIPAGTYQLIIHLQGYSTYPPGFIQYESFVVGRGHTTHANFVLLPHENNQTGYITGKVTSQNGVVPGALVVAEANNRGDVIISDHTGNFLIPNIGAGSYTLSAWKAGYNTNTVTTNVIAGKMSAADVEMQQNATGKLSGSVEFKLTDSAEIHLALLHPISGHLIPGLTTNYTSGVYTISRVPDGTFQLIIAYKNDKKVGDTYDLTVEGDILLTFTGGKLERDVTVIPSVALESPTNTPLSPIPETVNSSMPTLKWKSYSGADHYVVEVSRIDKGVIWGGFSNNYNIKNNSYPASQTIVYFNTDGNATEPLRNGYLYRFSVYACIHDTTAANGFRIISKSEEQMGLFIKH